MEIHFFIPATAYMENPQPFLFYGLRIISAIFIAVVYLRLPSQFHEEWY